MGSQRVALVSTDGRFASALSEQLRLTADLSVASYASAAEALRSVDGMPPIVWLIDQQLVDMSGLALARALRGAAVAGPLMLLAGSAEIALDDADEIDDVIQRPIRLHFLLSRIAAHLADHDPALPSPVRIGPYALRVSEKLLVDETDQRRIRLTEKEVAILEYLVQAKEPTSREALLHEVWGYQAGVTSHTLETHVYRLRQKIEIDPSNAVILINEAGGYRLAS